MVKDLLDETETDKKENALKLTALASATPGKDDVRAIQAQRPVSIPARAMGFWGREQNQYWLEFNPAAL
jgi:hypothetical protein